MNQKVIVWRIKRRIVEPVPDILSVDIKKKNW